MRIVFEQGATPHDLKLLRVGAYVRVHPASDWFMRGVTHARVRAVGRKWVHVTVTMGRGMGLNIKLAPRSIMELTQ